MDKFGHKCRELMVAQTTERIKGSGNYVITGYDGLKVTEIEELKKSLKQIPANFLVIKNSIIKRVFKELKVKGTDALTQGPTAVGFTKKDALGISRVFVDFKKKHSSLVIRGGIFNNEHASAELITELAGLPSRDALLAKVAGGLKSPINGLAVSLSGILRKLVSVLDAIKAKNSK